MNKILSGLLKSFFAPVSSSKGAIASSLGFLLGLLPIYGLRFPVMICLCILFRLNIVALFFGMVIPIFLPFIRHMSFLFANVLGGYSLSFDNIKFWLFSYHLHQHIPVSEFTTGITACIYSLIAFPFFHWFYNLGINKTEIHEKHVFLDPSERRWTIIKRMSFGFLILSLVISVIFIESINNNPLFPNIQLKNKPNSRLIFPIFKDVSNGTMIKQLKYDERKYPDFQLDFKKHNHKLDKHTPRDQHEVYGFYVNWDENSKNSLTKNIGSLSVLVPEWLHLGPDLSFKDTKDASVIKIAEAHKVRILPLINNFDGSHWDGNVLHQLFTKSEAEEHLINQLLEYVKTNHFSGINLDFEDINDGDKDHLTAFVQEISKVFHQNGLIVTQDVPADDNNFDYPNLAKYMDRMIVMIYDEHSSIDSPGPIASSKWVNEVLDSLDVPPKKTIISLGSYGYDWNESAKGPAEPLTYGDIMDMGADTNLHVQWNNEAGNPYLQYQENGDHHIIWFLDAATFYNQMRAAYDNDVKGVALWRLGSEDPSIWKIINKPKVTNPVERLSHLIDPSPANYKGSGEVLKIASPAVDGVRTLQVNSGGTITSESYKKLPKPFEIIRYGKPKRKEVVLSFDDGPDPIYTPKVLDILDKNHIKGSFYIVGENAELHPELIERMYREGHEIGSHTFTHPNIASTSAMRTKMELNANQRLFEEITGHSMTLFRPPYVADAEPSTKNEILPILRAQQMGYTMVGELIDPQDWQKPSSEVIVKRVLKHLNEGNVILLHDAGGDRTNTLKALPIIIKELKKRGYTFTTVGQLIGKNNAEIMPSASKDGSYFVYDRAVFKIFHAWHEGLNIIFLTVIVLGIIRLSILIYLSWRQVKRYKEIEVDPGFKPLVSVVIAAYNEEKVIKKTIESILKSNYPSFEILVIDDGSKDDTAQVVREAFQGNPYVRIITKDNGGKSSAVNVGFQEARDEIVVALDADTLIAEDAITLLVRHFKEKQVAAVSGNVKVGNKGNLLTNWQHIEYVTGFNLERRAFAELNCITVVPGAIGAWRKDVVEKAGYFKDDTLAEDTDITLTILRLGYKIEFEEKAYAYTEVPEDIKSLAKQRYRWTYGTLQCLWKHRHSLFQKKHTALGFIGLPNMWIFQYLNQIVSPVADLLFVYALFSAYSGKAIIGFMVFYLIDFLSSLYAFRLEKEDPKPLVSLILQRILYKQLMTYVVVKSIFSAIRGITVGWNKLNRNGNVTRDSLVQKELNH